MRTCSPLLILLLLAALSFGCDESGSAPETGTVSLYLTDAPADDFDFIFVDIEEVTLVGAPWPVTVFEGKRTFDLKQLESLTELLHLASDVPARCYSTIRLGVSRISLVRSIDGPEVEEVEVDPPAGGVIDLEPRGGFCVRGGGNLVVEIDIDAAASLELDPALASGYRFHPVVQVEIGERMPLSKPFRTRGSLHERLDDDRFVLCPGVYGVPVRYERAGWTCVVVEVDESTGVLGRHGDPASLADLRWPEDYRECAPSGDGIPTDPSGSIEGDVEAVYVELDGVEPSDCVTPVPPLDFIPTSDLMIVGHMTGELGKLPGEAPLARPVLRAAVIEEGADFVWETLSGVLYEEDDAAGSPTLWLEPDPDPFRFQYRPVLEAIVQPGTRMFDREGNELDFDLGGEAVRVRADVVLARHPDWIDDGDPLVTLEDDPEAFAYKLGFVAFGGVVESD